MTKKLIEGLSLDQLIFQKDKIVFSEDLVKNSSQGFETLVKVGQTIGRLKESD